jgi:flagellar FlgN protein
MSLSELSNILWRERRLLELLAFKLEEEHLVLSSGRTRWLARASGEVDVIIDEIKHVRLERAMRMADSSHELGLSDTPTLRELANSVEPPWAGIFWEHRRALHTLGREIESVTRVGRSPAAALGEIDIAGDDAIGVVPDRSRVLRLVDDEP